MNDHGTERSRKAIKRLEGFSKEMQERYGGFEPGRMKESASKRLHQVLSVVKAARDEVKKTVKAMEQQAKRKDSLPLKQVPKELAKDLNKQLGALKKKLGL